MCVTVYNMIVDVRKCKGNDSGACVVAMIVLHVRWRVNQSGDVTSLHLCEGPVKVQVMSKTISVESAVKSHIWELGGGAFSVFMSESGWLYCSGPCATHAAWVWAGKWLCCGTLGFSPTCVIVRAFKGT